MTHRDSRLANRYGRYPVHSTADDISATAGDGEDVAPVVVLVAIGERAFVRAFDVDGELVLGRRIATSSSTMIGCRASTRRCGSSAARGSSRDRGSHNGTFVDGARVEGESAPRRAWSGSATSVFLLVRDGRGLRARCAADEADQVIGPELARVYDRGRAATRRERHAARPRRERHRQGARGAAVPRAGRAPAGRSSRSTAPRSPKASPSACCSARARARSRARRDATGYCQRAHGGTLFLDEIGELDRSRCRPSSCASLETREVVPVGATRADQVDSAIVAREPPRSAHARSPTAVPRGSLLPAGRARSSAAAAARAQARHRRGWSRASSPASIGKLDAHARLSSGAARGRGRQHARAAPRDPDAAGAALAAGRRGPRSSTCRPTPACRSREPTAATPRRRSRPRSTARR